MNAAAGTPADRRARWLAPLAAGAVVLAAQLALVATAGHDIPFHDQWDAEGRWLYPGWRDGTVGFADLFRAHNEHRILWTHLLNLALFAGNGGRWDPFVQLAAGAGLHALVALTVAYLAGRESPAGRVWALAGATAVAFVPLAAWHNALWGFQSQVYFVLLFAGPALAWLPRTDRRRAGAVCALAALVAMGAGALVPVAAGLVLAIRVAEERAFAADRKAGMAALAVLLVVAVASRTTVAEHAGLAARSPGEFLAAWVRLLAWPHAEQPLAALVLNAPLAIAVGGRLMRRRRPAAGEDVAVALGLWSVLVSAAAAWTRGGGDELATGVPSRYVDFLVLLPLANLWCALAFVAGARPRVRVVAAVWALFLAVGWTGVSADMYRRIIRPLARDREAPARLLRAWQRSRDPAVFSGQPRLYVPHPHLENVAAVLDDPRLAGALPPSLQPDKPPGPLSRAARGLLGRTAGPPGRK